MRAMEMQLPEAAALLQLHEQRGYMVAMERRQIHKQELQTINNRAKALKRELRKTERKV